MCYNLKRSVAVSRLIYLVTSLAPFCIIENRLCIEVEVEIETDLQKYRDTDR